MPTSTKTTQLTIHPDFKLADVPRRLFGSFVEHLGRCVYGGIFEPGHPTANADGFRTDVLDLVRELGVSVIRYPGGNFVSGYNWEDGVGPVEKRPRRRELAWMATESNRVGTDEFIRWCRAANVEPMLAVNLGTRGPVEAGAYFEYCNHPSGTALADQRIANGSPAPHDVRLWCLGNEMDGPWQMGQLPAPDYGRKAREAAKLMTFPDVNRSSTPLPPVEFIVCGSSSRGMPSFAHWDQAVLEECFQQVQYLSVHSYVDPASQDVPTFLAFPEQMGLLIREITAICDAVAAKRKSPKRIMLSYDEWNVWSMSRSQGASPAWSEAPPLLEDVYTLADALCVGGMLITLLNHCDRVRIACQAQLVNVIGLIMTRTGGPAWRQTIFHPFALTSRHSHGHVLQLRTSGPTYTAHGTQVPTVLTAAILHDDGGITIFALNRDLQSTSPLEIDLRAFKPLKLAEWQTLTGADLTATNTESHPDRIRPTSQSGATLIQQTLHAPLPPASWNMLRLQPV